MSVYINGMEMPKPGRYEAVIIVLDKSTAEIAISPAEDDIGYWKEYPLVPVPKHGDLIDRNEAICHLFNGEQCLYSWDEIEEAIDATTAIIPSDPAEEGE